MNRCLELIECKNNISMMMKACNRELNNVPLVYDEVLTQEVEVENAKLAHHKDLIGQLERLKEDYAKVKDDKLAAEKELAKVLAEKKSDRDKKLRRRERLKRKIASREADIVVSENALKDLKMIVSNVKLFMEHYAIGLGGYEDADSKTTLSMIYFSKINPSDPKKKYFIIFSRLRLTSGGANFDVLKVEPSFPQFEVLKTEMNEKQNLVEVIAKCLEHWKKMIVKSEESVLR